MKDREKTTLHLLCVFGRCRVYSPLAFFHLMLCFCTFAGPSLLETKFCRKFFFLSKDKGRSLTFHVFLDSKVLLCAGGRIRQAQLIWLIQSAIHLYFLEVMHWPSSWSDLSTNSCCMLDQTSCLPCYHFSKCFWCHEQYVSKWINDSYLCLL